MLISLYEQMDKSFSLPVLTSPLSIDDLLVSDGLFILESAIRKKVEKVFKKLGVKMKLGRQTIAKASKRTSQWFTSTSP